MSYTYRFEIYPKIWGQDNENNNESQSERSLKKWLLNYMDLKVDKISEIRFFLLESSEKIDNISEIASEIFCDDVLETLLFSADSSEPLSTQRWLKNKGYINPYLIERYFRAGVTDNSAHAALEALKLIPSLNHADLIVSSGLMYFIEGENLTSEILLNVSYEKFANFLLHKVQITKPSELILNKRLYDIQIPKVQISASEVKFINLNQSDENLLEMNQQNCWAFSLSELHHIRAYFKKLGKTPTDVEIEILAQTWSEHCKHKIFSSEINYSEGALPKGAKELGSLKVEGLFKTFIRGSTLKIKNERSLPWLISIFHDNAGIVRFDETVDVCIKVETHNSPSALDPYGGALTGILGVNRDIYGVGLGAKPIANTNVFCLAENDYFKKHNQALPLLLKNPDRIKEGVHLGVQDGGNKSGIPTVNGAFVFDRDFVGKPLVFCGTIGVIPQKENNYATSLKGQKPGDLIVMSGGRIGKDGIHGATFSSMELFDGVPSSVVQIGDPITQKRLGDFLIEARTLGLFTSVTDNGAGGLSSSVGEMAQGTNGAIVDLEKALVKYPGLSPFELMVSESQERMTFSVHPTKIDHFLALSKKRNVESCVIGEFTVSGQLVVRYNKEVVADLSLSFLHESLKPMKLEAHFDLETKAPHWMKDKKFERKLPKGDFKKIILDLFKSSNIRSQEHLIRRYDHEVKGATIVKPFTGEAHLGFHAPSDAGVIWMKPHGGNSDTALAISSGIASKISRYDTYSMAEFALDEAVRNAVSTGANPDEMVLTDNFCWPDPIESSRNPDAKLKLAELVRASKAIYDLSLSYGMPFVSGKDSMKNDFVGRMENGENVKISVPPTLLVTALGKIPSLKTVTTSEFKNSEALIYLVGEALTQYQSAFELAHLYDDYFVEYPIPSVQGKKQLDLYRSLHKSMREGLVDSSHDVSDGGVAIALLESMIGTSLGADVDLALIKDLNEKEYLSFFFNEGMGRFIVSVLVKDQKEFEENLSGHPFLKLGTTNKSGVLKVYYGHDLVFSVGNEECLDAYRIEAKEMDR